ncbi:MAG TPA: hypothetical protein VKT76_14950 [Bradyrhizobium sp.]|nr:hypothetical protein [Bradyrhizobium sp.]
MLKLASKFAMDVFPSVIATIIGAYIVNHYINNKPPADAAATAAAVSSANPKKETSKGDSKPAEKSADLGNMPEPGVRAKGIPEKAITDKASVDKPADKSDKPSETASLPASAPVETRRHQLVPRDKPVSKAAPATTPPVAPLGELATANPPPAEAVAPDANDLARAAIERLRGNEPSARAPETSHVVTVPAGSAPVSAPVVTPPAQPLPPPILVSTPTDLKPQSKRADDPLRPTPPADIPDPPPPLDLRADAVVDAPPKGRPSVAEDVLSAAKSMFHSVLPK